MVKLIGLADKEQTKVDSARRDRKIGLVDNSELEETRRCLSNMAHSRSQTHAGYLIAIVIGSLALISRWDIFFSVPQKPVSSLTTSAFFILIGAIAFAAVYLTKRMFYWNTYASTVPILSTVEIEELFEEYEKGNDEEDKEENNRFQYYIRPSCYVLNGAVAQHIKKLRKNEKIDLITQFSIIEEKEFIQISFLLGLATGLGLFGFYLIGAFSLIFILGTVAIFVYLYPALRHRLYKLLLKYWRKNS